MAENITFDFNQSIPEQGLLGETSSPLETPIDPPKKGRGTFSNSLDSLNTQSVKDIYASDQPQGLLGRLNRPVGPGGVAYAPESLTDQYMYQEGFEAKHFNPFDTTNYQKFADKESEFLEKEISKVQHIELKIGNKILKINTSSLQFQQKGKGACTKIFCDELKDKSDKINEYIEHMSTYII